MQASQGSYLKHFDLVNFELVLAVRQIVLALLRILVNIDRPLVISLELVEATLVDRVLEFDVEGRVEDEREVLVVADFCSLDVAELDDLAIVSHAKHERQALVLFLTAVARPRYVCIASESVTILGPQDTQRGTLVIAIVVEILRREAVYRTLVNQFEFKLTNEVGKLVHLGRSRQDRRLYRQLLLNFCMHRLRTIIVKLHYRVHFVLINAFASEHFVRFRESEE